MKVFKLGEMFCGPGGLALGASRADFGSGNDALKIEHEWAIDYDEDSCKTFRNNICPSEPHKVICADVRELDITKLPPIDCFVFGFPCNDFSVVGEQRGMDGIYGPLYSYGVKALKYFQPKFFMAENVGGLRNANDGTSFDKILNDLQKAG